MGKCCSSTNNNPNANANTNKTSNTQRTNNNPEKDSQMIQSENPNTNTITAQKQTVNVVKSSKKENTIVQGEKNIKVIEKIKIRFYYEGKPIDLEPAEVNENLNLNQVLEPVHSNLPKLSDYSFTNKEYQEIDINESLEKIFAKEKELEKNDFYKNVKIINVVYQGLEIPTTLQDIIKEYNKTTLIGNPVAESNPFELRIFDSESMVLSTATFNIEDYPELLTFSHFSAYCNGNNYLYLSGGETESKDHTTGNFDSVYLNWISKINLKDGKLTKLEPMKVPRIWHSMIFVPNKYVFIVGGNKTLSVEILNIETGEVHEDSLLNEFHSESTLCLVNSNYLYCFLGYKLDELSEYSNVIERCNLREKNRKWEIVSLNNQSPENSSVSPMFETRFFVVSYYTEDSILIFGGDNINNNNQLPMTNDETKQDETKAAESNTEIGGKNTEKRKNYNLSYIYNFNKNTLKEFDFTNFFNNKNQNSKEVEKAEVNLNESMFQNYNDISRDVFPEKFFVPMKTNTNEQISCMIPMQTQDKLKVYLMNSESHIEIKEFEDELNNQSSVLINNNINNIIAFNQMNDRDFNYNQNNEIVAEKRNERTPYNSGNDDNNNNNNEERLETQEVQDARIIANRFLTSVFNDVLKNQGTTNV